MDILSKQKDAVVSEICSKCWMDGKGSNPMNGTPPTCTNCGKVFDGKDLLLRRMLKKGRVKKEDFWRELKH